MTTSKKLTFLTASIQGYLKYIYLLTTERKAATTTALSERLGVSPASVTGMLRRLAQANPPLVVYKKHRGVILTPKGEKAALEVIRHHRLLETWLVRSLGYSWDEVHEEACRLEHAISEGFEARLASALGHPTHDPHGEPIPDKNLALPAENLRPLASLRPSQRGTIRRIRAESNELLRHLGQIGLVPGTRLSVTAYSPLDNNLTVKVEGKTAVVIGSPISEKIFVEAY